jgi:hypothetical protein
MPTKESRYLKPLEDKQSYKIMMIIMESNLD